MQRDTGKKRAGSDGVIEYTQDSQVRAVKWKWFVAMQRKQARARTQGCLEGSVREGGLDRRNGRMTGLEGQALERKATSGSGYRMFRVAGYVSRADGLDSTD